MDPSSTGRLTRSKSLSRASSPHPTGSAATPSVTTPSHRTDRPWNEVTKGGSTPRDAALPPPRPDHPFESANQFARLRPADDDASDDGTQRSADLLTPGDLTPREDVPFSTSLAGDTSIDKKSFDGDEGFDGPPPAGKVLTPPVAADRGSLSLEDLVRANAVGIAALKEMMQANAANITVLSHTVTTTSSQLTSMSAALTDATATAARAFRLASNAQLTITGQGVQLGELTATVSTLSSDIDNLRTSIPPPLDLPTLIESALDPLRKSVVDSVTNATETAEAMIRSSFDNSATALDDRVRESLEAFDKRIDALGSSYGHLTKTTLPTIARRLDALDARARPPTPPPADKIDPSADKIARSDDDTNETDGVALEDHDDAHVGVTTRTRQAWAASRARYGVDPHPSGTPTAGSPRATYTAPAGSGRGLLRTPVANPYHQSPTSSFRDNKPLRQTTIPESMHGPRSGSQPTHGPRSTPSPAPVMTATTHRVVGGPIVSPRHSDRAIHARSMGASRFDVIRLATPEYHIGMDGTDNLTEDTLQDCGYSTIKATVDDVMVCYNDIILVHHKVMELWYNVYAHTSGPQVDKVLQKSLTVFPKLSSMCVEDVVGFYDRLQEVSMGYCLALMPFDAVVLKNRFEGLCPPGLGLIRYAAMSKGFMELLPWLIPVTLSPQVSATLAAVRYESNNGYDYLWRVLELAVPGFDPTVSITIPSWDTADDIFHFAQAYLLYFRLQAKVNFHYDDRTRSGIFLRAVQFSDYADTVTTLQSHVNSFRDEYEDGYLPPHLRLHGLATSINQNAQARLRDIANPRMRRLDGDFSRVQGVPTCHRVGREETPRGGGFRDRGGDRNDRGGETPRGGGFRDRGGDRNDRGGFRNDRATPRGGRDGDRDGRPSRGRGLFPRPDRNRRPFLPDVQCAACKRVGHVAKHCDMLATAICLERYMKRDMSATLRDSIEKEWLDRWKELLGNPTQTPRQILRAYVEELDITVTGLDDVMEWDCWSNSDPDDASQDE